MKAILPEAKFPSTLWLVILLFLLLGLSGCAVSHPAPNLTTPSQPDYVLKPGTYRVIGRVEGHASCPFLFWVDVPEFWPSRLWETSICEHALWPTFTRECWQSREMISIPLVAFALGDIDLRARAMADLHKKVEIQGNRRVLHNIMEEATLANYLGLFAILDVTISAEVIEFTGSQSS